MSITTLLRAEHDNYFAPWYRSKAITVGAAVYLVRPMEMLDPDTDSVIELLPNSAGMIIEVDEWPNGRRDVFVHFEDIASPWPCYFAPEDFFGAGQMLEMDTTQDYR